MTRLSICIATFNRGAFLGETLASVVEQLRDGVEIVIVDGGSTDATADVIAAWQARCPAIRYVRQATNGGVDRDYARAVELAQGRYCWLFTDDDLLLPGAVDAVFEAIDDGPALVIVNAEVWDATFEHCADANRLRIAADRRYERGQDDALLADTGRYLTFIGGVVVRRDVWEARAKEPYFGSLFIHVGVLFQSPLPAHAKALARPGIRIRYGNAGWTPRAFEVWMFKWPELVWSLPRAAAAKRRLTAREPARNPLQLLIHRAAGSYDAEQYRRWLAPRARGAWRVLAAIVAHIPRRPLNALLRAALAAIGFGHRTTAIDLRNAPWRRR
jgi:glycosyltransferase involved in cell wall biosynthesis